MVESHSARIPDRLSPSAADFGLVGWLVEPPQDAMMIIIASLSFSLLSPRQLSWAESLSLSPSLLFPYSVRRKWQHVEGEKMQLLFAFAGGERESGFSFFDIAGKIRTAGKILFLLPFSFLFGNRGRGKKPPPLLFSPPEPDFGTLDRY